jgi:prepilin-type N-terminal cleavage/methylation domain-containing protein
MPPLEASWRFADTGHVWLRVLRRLRQDEGFGLVELMIAMLILTVGLLALLSAFVSGSTTLRRASRTATASTIADTQMELYRALTYGRIAVDSSTIPTTSPYTTDSAYSASQVTATCSGTVADNPQCNASRTVTGPDHGIYRVDTYIVFTTPTSGRPVKLVTIAVRDVRNLNGRALARISSAFDQSTGL